MVQLRNRLIAMGYLRRSPTPKPMTARCSRRWRPSSATTGFARTAWPVRAPCAMINTEPATRLSQIIVAMERERWINKPLRQAPHLGEHHRLSRPYRRQRQDHLPDPLGRRVRNTHDRRTPEFSDVMEHMVINPTWNVPRSIAVKEYLPHVCRRIPYAVGHLEPDDRCPGPGRAARSGWTSPSSTKRPFPST